MVDVNVIGHGTYEDKSWTGTEEYGSTTYTGEFLWIVPKPGPRAYNPVFTITVRRTDEYGSYIDKTVTFEGEVKWRAEHAYEPTPYSYHWWLFNGSRHSETSETSYVYSILSIDLEFSTSETDRLLYDNSETGSGALVYKSGGALVYGGDTSS